jgi:hypothetical protein
LRPPFLYLYEAEENNMAKADKDLMVTDEVIMNKIYNIRGKK